VLPFRTIRQRRRRAHKAQVAAVATILALLLVVTFISNYLLTQLPSQETAAEFDHVLQVENQLARFQATVLAEADQPNLGLALSSPVTLGSQSVPPFGPAASGAISPEAASISTQTSYSLADIAYAPPTWNFGSSCLTGGNGSCSGNGHIDTWNITNVNNTAFTVTIHGNSNSLQYNITGSNDTIAVDWTGGDTGYVNVIVNGSYDTVTFNKGGSDTTSPILNFFFYGQHDTFNFNPSGSHSSAGGMTLDVVFIGELGLLCPYGNASGSDRVGTLASGGSNLNMTVTWWNFVGYRSGPTTGAYPGGSGSNETLHWENLTGVVACAFTKPYISNYQTAYGEGLLVHLYNRYVAQTDVAYDQGAVIERQVGGEPIMLSPPKFTTGTFAGGLSASLTLVNILSNFSTDAGLTTAAITSQVVSVHRLVMFSGVTQNILFSPFWLNISTAYPQAWMTFFAGHANVFPSGATCSSSVVILPPYTCANPPAGVSVTVHAALVVARLSVTTITLLVSVN
jgi:hypothetical protein